MSSRDEISDTSTKRIGFVAGQIHGLQAKAFFADKGLYYALISAWGEKIGKAESNRYHFDLRGYRGQFYSKGSGLKHEDRPLFEYVIELKKGYKKLFLTFSPRLVGMEFRKGEKWNLNKRQGEGVECSIQSSYHSPEKIKNLIKDVFWFLDLKRFFISWDLNETYLISFENYIRYNRPVAK